MEGRQKALPRLANQRDLQTRKLRGASVFPPTESCRAWSTLEVTASEQLLISSDSCFHSSEGTEAATPQHSRLARAISPRSAAAAQHS